MILISSYMRMASWRDKNFNWMIKIASCRIQPSEISFFLIIGICLVWMEWGAFREKLVNSIGAVGLGHRLYLVLVPPKVRFPGNRAELTVWNSLIAPIDFSPYFHKPAIYKKRLIVIYSNNKYLAANLSLIHWGAKTYPQATSRVSFIMLQLEMGPSSAPEAKYRPSLGGF